MGLCSHTLLYPYIVCVYTDSNIWLATMSGELKARVTSWAGWLGGGVGERDVSWWRAVGDLTQSVQLRGTLLHNTHNVHLPQDPVSNDFLARHSHIACSVIGLSLMPPRSLVTAKTPSAGLHLPPVSIPPPLPHPLSNLMKCQIDFIASLIKSIRDPSVMQLLRQSVIILPSHPPHTTPYPAQGG